MANANKFQDNNPNLRTAGVPYPDDPHPLNVKKLLSNFATNEFSTYEKSYQKKIEKTELSVYAVNKHITELAGTIYRPRTATPSNSCLCLQSVVIPKNKRKGKSKKTRK